MTLKERIDFEVKQRFYYIEYPDGIDENLWKDRDGKIHFIEDMGLDHLRASIRIIERDIKNFENVYRRAANGPELIDALLPLAQSKLKDLKEQLKQQT